MESVTFDALIESYVRIGVLGLAAVVLILFAILLLKKILKDSDKKDTKLDAKDNELSSIYQKFLETQNQTNEYLIKEIVGQVTQHTPSAEENKKLNEVQNKISTILKDILIDTGASRTCLIQYHNGGRGINKQSFLKMSATIEQMQVGEKPFMLMFKDQFRSVLSYVVNTLEHNKYLYIEDINEIKEVDYGTYDFLQARNIKQIYFLALHGEEDMVIGFVMISFNENNKNDGNKELIRKVLKTKIQPIETLLSINL